MRIVYQLQITLY